MSQRSLTKSFISILSHFPCFINSSSSLSPALPLIFPAFLCVANLYEISSCYLLLVIGSCCQTYLSKLTPAHKLHIIYQSWQFNVRRYLLTTLATFLICYTNKKLALKTLLCIFQFHAVEASLFFICN